MALDEYRELIRSFRDSEYRREFATEQVAIGLAFQIRLLRESRGWTQEELAQRTSKAQETISQLENPNYGRHTVSTLKKLAAAFDVALSVRFVSFSELASRTVRLTPQDLAPPSFDEELRYTTTSATVPREGSDETLISPPRVGTSAADFETPTETQEREMAYA